MHLCKDLRIRHGRDQSGGAAEQRAGFHRLAALTRLREALALLLEVLLTVAFVARRY
jgi:hypothetical protein